MRRLDLLSEFGYLTADHCNELSHSSILIQCEVLLIKVEREMNILPLIENAPNLRALKIQCENGNCPRNISTCDDAIIKALRDHLPLTAEIDRDPKFKFYIRI